MSRSTIYFPGVHKEFFNKLNFICVFLILLFFSHSLFASIVSDTTAPKYQQPDIHHYIEERKTCKAQNVHCQGAKFTTINITTPNEKGLSHNKYDEFTLKLGRGHNKVFFNNLMIDSPGFIGNPNLVDKAAMVILNEVTSNKKSELHGHLAVIGHKADVIIANPSGIYCNGCQFSNTDHVALTTGIPTFRSGDLGGYYVTQGKIIISSNGLKHNDNSNVFLDLFSASLIINGEVRSGDVLTATGNNDIGIMPIKGSVDLKPIGDLSNSNKIDVVVDVTKLGGMYANKIFIYSKDGGIHNKGIIEAETMADLVSASFIKNNFGKIDSPKIRIRSSGDIDNIGGRIKSRRQGLSYNANDKFGIRIFGRNVNNSAGSIYINSGHISVGAVDSITNRDGIIKSIAVTGGADIKMKAKKVNNDNGYVITTQNIEIDATDLANNRGKIVSAFSHVDLHYKTLSTEDGIIHGGIEVKSEVKP